MAPLVLLLWELSLWVLPTIFLLLHGPSYYWYNGHRVYYATIAIITTATTKLT